MRRLQSIDEQGPKPLYVKRLRELEQENSLLKLLYTDLLQKISALKEGWSRSKRGDLLEEARESGYWM